MTTELVENEPRGLFALCSSRRARPRISVAKWRRIRLTPLPKLWMVLVGAGRIPTICVKSFPPRGPRAIRDLCPRNSSSLGLAGTPGATFDATQWSGSHISSRVSLSCGWHESSSCFWMHPFRKPGSKTQHLDLSEKNWRMTGDKARSVEECWKQFDKGRGPRA